MTAESDHPVFMPPDNRRIKIWRYMDFTKFVSMLDSGSLYFTRADLLGDPYEGALSNFNRAAWPAAEIRAASVDGVASKMTFYEWCRQWTYVSCWHMNETESAAMWKLYSQSLEAVAIQSRFDLLNDLLPSGTYIGTIKYIDYDKDWMPAGNTFYPFTHKRQAFEHEHELRALCETRPRIHDEDVGKKFDYSKINEKMGKLVEIDLNALIEQVYVAPTAAKWFRELTESILEKYELKVSVASSSIDAPPTF